MITITSTKDPELGVLQTEVQALFYVCDAEYIYIGDGKTMYMLDDSAIYCNGDQIVEINKMVNSFNVERYKGMAMTRWINTP